MDGHIVAVAVTVPVPVAVAVAVLFASGFLSLISGAGPGLH